MVWSLIIGLMMVQGPDPTQFRAGALQLNETFGSQDECMQAMRSDSLRLMLSVYEATHPGVQVAPQCVALRNMRRV